jgi:osmotically-inducible protein OsmY
MNVVDALTLKVEEALMNDNRTSDAAIEVGSYQGIVTLTGWVESLEAAQAAEEIANRQDGVVKVINSLVIESDDIEMDFQEQDINL